jgi:hypothetical protein
MTRGDGSGHGEHEGKGNRRDKKGRHRRRKKILRRLAQLLLLASCEAVIHATADLLGNWPW